MKKLFYLLILFVMIGCSNPQRQLSDVHLTKIFSVTEQKWLSYPQFLQQLEGIGIILLGEVHDQISHHIAEQRLLMDLQQSVKSVMLEMFPTKQQQKLNTAQLLLRQKMPEFSNKLRHILHWDNKWDWKQYSSLLSFITPSTINLYGANLDQQEIAVLWQGAYPLNGKISTEKHVGEKLKRILQITMEHHVHTAQSERILDKLIMIQQFKDRRMAETLINHAKPSVLIAGRYHVSKAVGVPLHLQDYQYLNYKVVILTSDLNAIDEQEADYIWLL